MKTTIEKGTIERKKINAFLKYWKENQNDPRDIVGTDISDDGLIEIGGEEYLVLTDSEADQRAREYILDSVWAFNKSFLDSHSEAIAEMDEEVFQKIQEMCEGANRTILRLIDDVEDFVDDAIQCDGRGHFLATYDNEENKVKLNGEWFYIYRTN